MLPPAFPRQRSHFKSGTSFELVKSIGIGFAEAADAIMKNSVDGKTLISAGFDQYLTMGIAEGGLGLKPMQKIRLKTEIEQFRKPSHSV